MFSIHPMTVKYSRECMGVFVEALVHGTKFTATGKTHLTLNDMFKSMETDVWEKEVKEAEKEKERRVKKAE